MAGPLTFDVQNAVTARLFKYSREFDSLRVWQRRIRLCQTRNRKSEIVDLVQP